MVSNKRFFLNPIICWCAGLLVSPITNNIYFHRR